MAVELDGECWNPKERRPKTDEEEEAVEIFRDFLKIDSISNPGPLGSYRRATDFLKDLCTKNGLQNVREFELVKGKPIVAATWPGSQPELKGILLNSHYDVVPAVLSEWHTDPFAAQYDKETGRIYGRGTQDMKCVCIQYVLAIGKLIKANVKPVRSFHLNFVPDEEIGGKDGMAKFVQSNYFRDLNIGMALDEGLANPADALTVFHGERTGRWFYVTAKGPTGHGSRFIPDTAVSKLLKFCNKALEFRKEQEETLGYKGEGCAHAQAKKMGDVTTINLTMLEAGVTCDGGKTYSLNVIPTDARAGFDMRVTPNYPLSEMLAKLDEWAKEAGEGVEWADGPTYQPTDRHLVSSIGEDSAWWPIIEKSLVESSGKLVIPEIFPAATDSRFVRQVDVPAFGFSPMANTPILLHEHNEYLDVGVYLEGIEIYEKFLHKLGMVEKLKGE
eukprot:CAMPEP_0201491732 /NCGR_PEP_ID=MMETSP0151_2-20130828/30981_1 /ASSEMBLY_ACC=CAM_ASM_000257 /TAXON_ID=200890 /ORGANISM="Paramoeba atlantica, Strain 621/1 / CCAP 1560/9" /LENGTH=444 /DNA_ID=CAMNT_0047878227 /DNA_START=69 /DNA_END=1403 /DNA_ORIENTATION=-